MVNLIGVMMGAVVVTLVVVFCGVQIWVWWGLRKAGQKAPARRASAHFPASDAPDFTPEETRQILQAILYRRGDGPTPPTCYDCAARATWVTTGPGIDVDGIQTTGTRLFCDACYTQQVPAWLVQPAARRVTQDDAELGPEQQGYTTHGFISREDYARQVHRN